MTRPNIKQRAVNFGNYLARLRTERGYSVRQLGYIAGVNASYISQMENHRRTTLPKIATINKLADALKVSPDRMYSLVGVKVDSDDPYFGARLREVRKSRHLSIGQLAYLADTSKASISRLENGHRKKPELETILKLSRILKVSPRKLSNNADLSLYGQFKSGNRLDLDTLLNEPDDLTWKNHPLTSDDIMAISLWFRTKDLARAHDIVGLYRLGLSFTDLCKKYHVNPNLMRSWLKRQPYFNDLKRSHLSKKTMLGYFKRLFPPCLDLLLNHHGEYQSMIEQYANGLSMHEVVRGTKWSMTDFNYLLKHRSDRDELKRANRRGYDDRRNAKR